MQTIDNIDHLLKLSWLRIAKLYQQAALEQNSSMTTGLILLNIHQENGTPSTMLGPLIGLEPRSLVRTLASMETQGLIIRESDCNDKRSVRIKLSTLGKEKRELSKTTVLKFNQRIKSQLGLTDYTELNRILTKLNNYLETELQSL